MFFSSLGDEFHSALLQSGSSESMVSSTVLSELYWPSPSSGGKTQWVPFGLSFVRQSSHLELTEFGAELSEFLAFEKVLSKHCSAHVLCVATTLQTPPSWIFNKNSTPPPRGYAKQGPFVKLAFWPGNGAYFELKKAFFAGHVCVQMLQNKAFWPRFTFFFTRSQNLEGKITIFTVLKWGKERNHYENHDLGHNHWKRSAKRPKTNPVWRREIWDEVSLFFSEICPKIRPEISSAFLREAPDTFVYFLRHVMRANFVCPTKLLS